MGWEGYLVGLGKKQRHELRRKMRRAEAYPERLEIRHVRQAPGLEAEVERFLSLMARDAAKAAFLTDAMRDYFHRLARAAAEGRWLDLVFLEFGGRAAAAYFNFDYRNRIWVYNSGLDPEFLTLSPGWVLMGSVIELAAREGKEAVDLLRGEEPYKVHLGGVPRYVERLRVTRPG
jgi:CelD/BcsL family acetyltransferase involved in cellulose biosynthesis